MVIRKRLRRTVKLKRVPELSPEEKSELNKIGNTEDLMGEKSTEESLFGNIKITQLRKSLIQKGYLKRQSNGYVTPTTKGWNWYFAKGKISGV